MRFDDEHPRPWSELIQFLTPGEVHAFRRYAISQGVLLELAEPAIVEAMYTDWRTAPEPITEPHVQ